MKVRPLPLVARHPHVNVLDFASRIGPLDMEIESHEREGKRDRLRLWRRHLCGVSVYDMLENEPRVRMLDRVRVERVIRIRHPPASTNNPEPTTQAFRFNNRKGTDAMRFALALKGIINKRLTYTALTGSELPQTC